MITNELGENSKTHSESSINRAFLQKNLGNRNCFLFIETIFHFQVFYFGTYTAMSLEVFIAWIEVSQKRGISLSFWCQCLSIGFSGETLSYSTFPYFSNSRNSYFKQEQPVFSYDSAAVTEYGTFW